MLDDLEIDTTRLVAFIAAGCIVAASALISIHTFDAAEEPVKAAPECASAETYFLRPQLSIEDEWPDVERRFWSFPDDDAPADVVARDEPEPRPIRRVVFHYRHHYRHWRRG